MEYRNTKGKEYLPPGYTLAPWVVAPNRGRFRNAVDNMILRALKRVNKGWYDRYLTRMCNRPYKVKFGEFRVDKTKMDAYKNKTINPKFYTSTFPQNEAERP